MTINRTVFSPLHRLLIRSRHLLRFGLLAILMGVLIVSCQGSPEQNLASQSPATETENCLVVEHDAGETQICGKPEKIAVLAPHMLDILLSLGIQPAGYAEQYTKGIGNPVTEIPVLGERVTSNPINLGLRDTPSLEAIVQLKPDLILGEIYVNHLYSNLSAIAPTLLFRGHGDDWKQSIQEIAQVFDREERAQAVIKSHEQKLASVRAQLAPVAETYPKILLVDARKLPVSFDLRDNTNISGGLIEELGFQVMLPSDDVIQRFNWVFSPEILPQLDADIIIAIALGDEIENTKRNWNQNPLTQSLRATQENRVYFVDYYVWGSNIRGPIAAEIIIDEAHQLLSPLAESN
ncbi:MAG: ABC transporter substrate-binding protein [Elainellaceae cyanobacterium]